MVEGGRDRIGASNFLAGAEKLSRKSLMGKDNFVDGWTGAPPLGTPTLANHSSTSSRIDRVLNSEIKLIGSLTPSQ